MQSQTDLYNMLTYTDSELDLSTPEQYVLEVCLSAHKLTFMVHRNNRIMGLRKLTTAANLLDQSSAAHVQDAVKRLEWYKPGFREIRLFIDDEKFTLVPEPLFESDKAATYLNLVYKNTAQDKILTTRLSNHAAVSVFGINDNLFRFIQATFSNVSVLHINQVLIRLASQYNGNDLKNHLLVQISDHFISVLYYQNKEIKFMNTFTVESDTDMVYYVLSVAALLKLPQEKFGVIVMGDVSVSSSTINLLKKYVPEVLMANRLEGIQYPVSFREFQDQQHYLAIHSLLCE